MEIKSISSTIDKSKTTEISGKIPKFRNYASQIYATFATNILKCTVGSIIGFTTVLVAEFHKENADIRLSVSDLTWFSSKFFMTPIGALFLGVLAQRFGSRLIMLISAIFYVIAFLLFYFATTSEMVLSAQAIAGLFFMVAYGPGITYVVEITQPSLRGALTASSTLSTMFAAFFVVLLSNFFYWRTIALVILVFPIVGFIAVYTIPESPHWLASNKRFSEAETSLCWVRGWASPDNVISEFNMLIKVCAKSSHHILDCSSKKNPSKWSSYKENVNFYLKKSFYVPLFSICLLFVSYSFTGPIQLAIYSIVIFRQINAPIDPRVAASISDAMRILGALVCVLSIHHIGKKKLTYISNAGGALTLFTSAAALLLKEYHIYSGTCQWVAAIAMMFTAFLTSIGLDKIIFILNAEIFPTKYRNVGVAIGLFIHAVSQAICNKIFLSLLEAVTLPGVFTIFGTGCITTCVIFHFIFIETEGKALQEIENHYNGE